MSDSEDEAQDWNALDARVLKRGEKDHAPDGTLAQQTTLQNSREAMYSALSRPASSLAKHIVECDWDPQLVRGVVRKVKGNYFTTIGWSEKTTTCLHPEEVIYLVQRGSMICYYNNQPLTVEGTMALLLSHVSSEKMLVYTHLKRLGYVVRRAQPSIVTPTTISGDSIGSSPLTSIVWGIAGFRINTLAWRPFYSSYESVHRDLQWIRAKPLKTVSTEQTLDFHVWKPASSFKRSRPPPPDFTVRVMSAEDPMPNLASIEADFELHDLHPSKKNTSITRIREGCRQFLYAVVDNGVVGFVRVAEPRMETFNW